MQIGVSGASGHLGKAAVAELIERDGGHHIVGISRTPATVHAAVEARHGDYDQPETLIAAYRGLDRLLIIPSSDVQPGRRDRHFVSAIDAAVRAGVGHVAMMSIAAAREVDERDMYAAYFTGEQHLMRAAGRWTILRMNYYAESFAQVAAISAASGIVPGLGENHVAFVSRDDVAAAAAGILLGDGHAGAIYNATGPAAISARERADLLSDITGKPTHFVVMDEAQLRDGMIRAKIPQEYVAALIDIERRFAAGDFDIVTGDVQRLAGHAPRPLRAVLSKQFG
ncbi:NAD(P)H-binding protein [Bradyrhizobium sp. CCBAU 45389]|uniref:NAD(P)H-binding protein n=1 Tax=Bradyrhizobium sp. CCBAU 45389 TaxID=858429 RepID=UPI0023050915|nr:NAD(P)H-binding protein [Bradyrhizobium sp. CCBAU 45389]MDA9403853.1 nucleoside-diphosphate sugar epimerase [Bradyrhizobium sp. CCBAU 45389]